ncbi:MAG: transglycosylase SLT domain-containing protein [Bdellovibrionales bacterium]|nr:transglycosylase SLT domain-containing protein [Bdellovibrionales bacterium]
MREHFPEDAPTAIAIAQCESGLKPEAYNPKNYDGSVDRGLLQLNSTHDARMKSLGLDPWDPEDNVKFARILYDESGFRPWVCFNKGLHLAFNR